MTFASKSPEAGAWFFLRPGRADVTAAPIQIADCPVGNDNDGCLIGRVAYCDPILTLGRSVG
jgi:hypothetical protein